MAAHILNNKIQCSAQLRNLGIKFEPLAFFQGVKMKF